MIIPQTETKFETGEEVYEKASFQPMIIRGILFSNKHYSYLVNMGNSAMAYYPEYELLSKEEMDLIKLIEDNEN